MADLLILGASVRAAACSALRAGYTPWCIDAFADADLARHATVRRAQRYPRDLFELAEAMPDMPWIYTGALENHPRLVRRLELSRSLWGTTATALRRIRDPRFIATALAQRGLPFLEVVLPQPGGRPQNFEQREWMLKRRRSAGGLHVSLWHGAANNPPMRGEFLQSRARGMSCAAVFIAAADETRLIGVTQQLIGADCGAPRPFMYAGSIGPLVLDDERREQWQTLGRELARSAGLQGIFGVDAVDDGRTIWPVEVNPRYTASVEVLERAFDVPLLELHAAACQGKSLGTGLCDPLIMAGKLVLYARRETLIVAEHADWMSQHNAEQAWPVLADLPAAGTTIRARQPMLTCLATARDLDAVESRLRRMRAIVERRLYSN